MYVAWLNVIAHLQAFAPTHVQQAASLSAGNCSPRIVSDLRAADHYLRDNIQSPISSLYFFFAITLTGCHCFYIAGVIDQFACLTINLHRLQIETHTFKQRAIIFAYSRITCRRSILFLALFFSEHICNTAARES